MSAPTRTRLAAAAVALVAGTSLFTGCGKDEKPEAELVCDLINPALVDQIADGRRWRAVGSLYYDGRFRDSCTVLASGDQLLTVTLFDYHDREASVGQEARAQVVSERTVLAKSCPQTTQAPVSDDQATSECVSEDKIRYASVNPNRLVRVSLAREFDVVATTAAVAKVAASINANADKISQ